MKKPMPAITPAMLPEAARFNLLLKDYKLLRKAMLPLHAALSERLPKPAFESAARGLRMLDGDRLLIQCRAEITILLDHALYSVRHGGKTTIERFRESGELDPASPEARLIDAMTRHRFTILKTEKTHAGVGCEVLDLLYGDNRLLVDLGLSKTMRKGSLLLTRVLDMGDYAMTTGASLPCPKPLLNQIRKKFFDLFDRGKLTVEAWQPEFIEIERFMLDKAMNAGGSLSVEYV